MKRMEYRYHTLDVFTDTPFTGNPLAVFPDAAGLTGDQMQAMARELNLSEAVFVLPPTTQTGTRKIRIFTPAREVPFAGHPTVGTALFLAQSQEVPLDGDETTLVLEERVGPVPVRITASDGAPVSAEFTAAAAPQQVPLAWDPEALGAMVSLPAAAIGADGAPLGIDGRLGPAFASAGLAFLLLPVRDVLAAESASLNSSAWAGTLPSGSESRMVYLVAPGGRGEGVDFHVRMFGPDVGVPEDPATGSAAAALGAYLGFRLPDGSYRWTVEQGLEMGRPSRLELSIDVDGGQARAIRVGGSAVPVSRGVMQAP